MWAGPSARVALALAAAASLAGCRAEAAPTRAAHVAEVEALCRAVAPVPNGLDLRQSEARSTYRTALRNRRRLYLDLLDQERPPADAPAFEAVYLGAITAIDANLEESRAVEEGRTRDADFQSKAAATAAGKARTAGAALGLSACLPISVSGGH